jgi:adenylosuccinate lyase
VVNKLDSISPLDGRYREAVAELAPFFSEAALIRYRVQVEVEYLISLSREKHIPELPPFSSREQAHLRRLYEQFTPADAERVKELEAVTGHDVKAVEYFLREKFRAAGKDHLVPWIHFALTSEDINNLAYTLMWRDALQQVYLPAARKLQRTLRTLARKQAATPLLALTHGQPATPTTLGKEIAVYVHRLERQLAYLNAHRLAGKLGGATGTWSAHTLAFPAVDWLRFTRRFVRSLGLEPNLLTTQVENHDSLAESYQAVVRINTILLDLCRDFWQYISRGLFRQKRVAGEVGSSTMPHKINPIHFENAEGNLELSGALFTQLAAKLPHSRLQRDLSGSTVIRNQGVALGHALLALKNLLKGLSRLAVDRAALQAELTAHWEVLAEAVQTILRKSGHEDAYEILKDLTRGRRITEEKLREFIAGLDLPGPDRERLLALTPELYTGLAARLVELI